ncbi:MAG TPA: hypothetical protein PK930_23265, partial [Leptospiraceae bacterium]|nr:hypothetical protein [Leptospiraceae bacterium]
QFGINVFESFKARNIPLKEAKDKTQEEKKKDNPTSNENSNNSPEGANSENPQEENLSEGSDTSVVSEDNYEKSYLEEGIETGNILISVVNGNNGAIYFVLVDDYFFVSNSIERLTQTLLAATKPSKYSIQGKKEMEGVMKEYYKEDILGLAYFNLTNTNFTPFLKPISENGESISLFFKTENDLLSADIYVTERKNENTEGSISIEKIQSSIPNDVLLAIYSNSIGIKEYINSLLNPGEAWPELSNMVKLFLKNGKVEEENYFPARAGSAILFHKSELKGGVNQLYPDMSLGYVSTKSDDTFLKSIFKTGKPKKETHLDIPIKNYSRESSEYSPSLYQIDKLNWISSNIENAKDCIAAAKGNKPTLSDLRSSQFESPWKESPHHIVLNWQRLKEDTRVLFIYGGLKSSLYTEKTIQNDIDPLLETFNWIESIHFSLGAKGSIYGKMKLSAL